MAESAEEAVRRVLDTEGGAITAEELAGDREFVAALVAAVRGEQGEPVAYRVTWTVPTPAGPRHEVALFRREREARALVGSLARDGHGPEQAPIEGRIEPLYAHPAAPRVDADGLEKAARELYMSNWRWPGAGPAWDGTEPDLAVGDGVRETYRKAARDILRAAGVEVAK